jgi:hypothetical protein
LAKGLRCDWAVAVKTIIKTKGRGGMKGPVIRPGLRIPLRLTLVFFHGREAVAPLKQASKMTVQVSFHGREAVAPLKQTKTGILLLALLWILLVGAAYARADLVHYYTFDEPGGLVFDQVGSADFYLIRNVSYSYPGFWGDSILLNTSHLETDAIDWPNNWTVSYWTKRTIFDSTFHPVINYLSPSGFYTHFWTNRNQISNGTISLYVDINGYNSWQFNTLSYNGSHVKIYLNGTLILTDILSIKPSYNVLILGNYSNYYYFGYLDELKIFNETLSNAQVSELYQNYGTTTSTTTTTTSSTTTTLSNTTIRIHSTGDQFYAIKACDPHNPSNCTIYDPGDNITYPLNEDIILKIIPPRFNVTNTHGNWLFRLISNMTFWVTVGCLIVSIIIILWILQLARIW